MAKISASDSVRQAMLRHAVPLGNVTGGLARPSLRWTTSRLPATNIDSLGSRRSKKRGKRCSMLPTIRTKSARLRTSANVVAIQPLSCKVNKLRIIARLFM